METQFVWREEYNLGVDSIDREHQQLFKIINKLFAFREEERSSRWACQESIKFFKGHAVQHFENEEKYMESIGYDGLEQHRHIHNSFRENTLPTLEQELEQSGYSPEAMDHFLGVCAGWLIGHTLTEDLAIVGKHPRKWEGLLPGEELTAIKKLIVQLLFDMFHLESHLISDIYGGEKFGKGIYYRLVYGTPTGDKCQEILLVFEEQLLINTVGKVMGIRSGKLDSMLLHATRHTARQFAGRVIEQFPDGDAYELKEESLLSYEQFQKILEKENLQASLLFDTGSGYFAYCTISPYLMEKDLDAPMTIDAGNAIAEVAEYLHKREAEAVQEEKHPRPKILVVDDSVTMRLGLKKLLAESYEVTLVESGVAAICAIALNPPNLILLDYEMPVCDGRQTLEMLRSEKAFDNIPVIFLTGRNDPESVSKVMALKPAGYLLKHLKPDEIKKKIDAFFARQKA